MGVFWLLLLTKVLVFEFPPILLAGTVAICDPRTGRVNKDYINCTTDTEAVSAIKITPTRIYVGLRNGSLSAITSYKEGGSFISRHAFSEQHLHHVTCIEAVTSRSCVDALVITGCQDHIIIWDASTFKPLLNLNYKGDLHNIIVDVKRGFLFALTSNILYCWTALNFNKISDSITSSSVIIKLTDHTSLPFYKILYDAPSSTVIIPVHKSIKIFDVQTGELIAELSGHVGDISALTWDTDIVETLIEGVLVKKRLCVVASGDSLGGVSLWDLHKLLEKLEFGQTTDRPLAPVQQHNGHISKIQILDIDAFKLISVSFDGYMKVWDLVTGGCIRDLHTRYFKNQPSKRRLEELSQNLETNERRAVKCLVSSLHQIVLGAGTEVRVWDFDPENQLERFKKPLKKSSGSRKSIKGFASPRAQLQSEARKDLKESNKVLQQERAEQDHRDKLATKMNIKNLTEAEMIDYAKMISLEQPVLSPPPFFSASEGSFWQFTPQLKPKLHDVGDFPPLATPSKDRTSAKSTGMDSLSSASGDAEPSSSSQPISITTRNEMDQIISPSSNTSRPRKMSLSEFISDDRPVVGSYESASPHSFTLGVTSSSYRNVWQGHLAPTASTQTSSDDELEDNYFSNLRSPGSAAGVRRQSGQSVKDWSSVQVVPHPSKSREKEEEDELQYALELSLFEK